ncbi:MAG: NADPH-dependent FMN reductase [Xanthomonadales bacterium]|jgi:chromate reductase|nr:NADPH-dependent FMN reductase [Xanthomonadales bacterium]
MKLIGLCGSLREDSYNQRLLEAARQLIEARGATFGQGNIGALPHYNSDLETDELPEAVETLKQLLQDADALLIVSPEYNYSVPGPLKNAIDWLSRPAYRSVLAKLPTGILSASMSPIGGARMQGHLKNILAGTLTPVAPLPEFVLATAQNAFDEASALTSERARKALETYVGNFLAWASVD